jgi:hypothetical protein
VSILQAPLSARSAAPTDEAPEVHLVYDETISIKASTFRYRLWFGKNRMTICVVNALSGESPSLRSSALATRIFNTHIARVKKDPQVPFIFIELLTTLNGAAGLYKVEFERSDDNDSQFGVGFLNPRPKSIPKQMLETLVGGPVEGV